MEITRLDWRAPLDVFAALVGEPDAHLLHAGERAAPPRWSFIVSRPTTRYALRAGAAFVDGSPRPGDPFAVLSGLVAERAAPSAAADATAAFLSGAVGFLGYEAGAVLEPSAAGPRSPYPLPDAAFGFYDAALAFDREDRRVFLVERAPGAGARLRDLMTDDVDAGRQAAPGPVAARGLAANFSRAQYEAAVGAVVEKIRNGDVFQVNIAQQLSADLAEGDVYELFRQLMMESAAPFGAFLQYEEGAILSNSPERFFRIDSAGAHIRAEPIKGTRPRGATPAEDAALARDLLGDAKERAENIMIADLLRNDLSRICEDDSIEEPQICALVSDASVHHMVSTVIGTLREGCGAVEALRALFPCGSITGAPKIEAMKTIAAIEPAGRGPYCGAVGFIDDAGGADFAVAIRVLIAPKHSKASPGSAHGLVFPVGGGVTLRSDPPREYEETLHKARSFLATLGLDSGRIP